MRSRIAPLTALAVALLAGVDAWLISVVLQGEELQAQPLVMEKTASSTPLEGAGTPVRSKPPRAHAETLAHPVFYKTRAPYAPPPPLPPPAAAPAPTAPADPGIVLGGVAMHAEQKKAYLFSKGGAQGTWVSEGDTFLGWTRAVDRWRHGQA
jgi:hypothetical protein